MYSRSTKAVFVRHHPFNSNRRDQDIRFKLLKEENDFLEENKFQTKLQQYVNEVKPQFESMESVLNHNIDNFGYSVLTRVEENDIKVDNIQLKIEQMRKKYNLIAAKFTNENLSLKNEAEVLNQYSIWLSKGRDESLKPLIMEKISLFDHISEIERYIQNITSTKNDEIDGLYSENDRLAQEYQNLVSGVEDRDKDLNILRTIRSNLEEDLEIERNKNIEKENSQAIELETLEKELKNQINGLEEVHNQLKKQHEIDLNDMETVSRSKIEELETKYQQLIQELKLENDRSSQEITKQAEEIEELAIKLKSSNDSEEQLQSQNQELNSTLKTLKETSKTNEYIREEKFKEQTTDFQRQLRSAKIAYQEKESLEMTRVESYQNQMSDLMHILKTKEKQIEILLTQLNNLPTSSHSSRHTDQLQRLQNMHNMDLAKHDIRDQNINSRNLNSDQNQIVERNGGNNDKAIDLERLERIKRIEQLYSQELGQDDFK